MVESIGQSGRKIATLVHFTATVETAIFWLTIHPGIVIARCAGD